MRRHKQPFILESDVLQMEVVVDSDAFQRRHLHLRRDTQTLDASPSRRLD